MPEAKFLTCPPQHFQVSYEINPWMKAGTPVPDAPEQYAQFVDTLQVFGAEIDSIEPREGLPDLVFTANAALIHDEGRRAVISTFCSPKRRPEERIFETELRARGLATTSIQGAFFEGAGDALFKRTRRNGTEDPVLFCGHGFRTERAAVPLLQQQVDAEVVPLKLVDPRFYHLDTAFHPLDRGHAMAYMPAFDKSSQDVIERHYPGSHLIRVDPHDAELFACNARQVGNMLVLNRGISGDLKGQLRRAWYGAWEVDLTDFLKAGGSAQCLTLDMLDGPPPTVRPPAVRRYPQVA